MTEKDRVSQLLELGGKIVSIYAITTQVGGTWLQLPDLVVTIAAIIAIIIYLAYFFWSWNKNRSKLSFLIDFMLLVVFPALGIVGFSFIQMPTDQGLYTFAFLQMNNFALPLIVVYTLQWLSTFIRVWKSHYKLFAFVFLFGLVATVLGIFFVSDLRYFSDLVFAGEWTQVESMLASGLALGQIFWFSLVTCFVITSLVWVILKAKTSDT